MTDKKTSEPKQKTKPRGIDEYGDPYDPIEIPIPKKKDVLSVLKKAAQPVSKKTEKKSD
jgi:hypothetical protein